MSNGAAERLRQQQELVKEFTGSINALNERSRELLDLGSVDKESWKQLFKQAEDLSIDIGENPILTRKQRVYLQGQLSEILELCEEYLDPIDLQDLLDQVPPAGGDADPDLR